MKKLLLLLIMPLLFSCSDSTFDVHTFYQEMEDVGLFLPPDSLIVHAYIMGSDGEHKTPSYQETLGMEVNLYWDVIYKVDQLLYNEIQTFLFHHAYSAPLSSKYIYHLHNIQ